MSGPPHGLTNSERSRLVRSNRKLQALLGETPQVIAAAYHAALPSATVAQPPPTTNRPRPQLLLRLPSPGLKHKHSLSAPSPTTPKTPLSPTSSITLNNPPILSRTPSMKDLRRRHLAKLARTLGENIAPELVPEPLARPIPTLRRTATTSFGPSERVNVTVRSIFVPPAVVVVDDGTIAASPSPSSPPPPQSPAPRSSARLVRSSSSAAAPGRARTTGRLVHRRRGSVAVFTEEESESERAHAQAVARLAELQTGKRRKEKEWSGEWNREMQAVAQKLRALK
ncbi:hypothetical protein C8R46DRAFT_1308578 [Mycena filopes]|nr:hypothetical protein C8R46DRAFT_1308578 [Mycena filopes]